MEKIYSKPRLSPPLPKKVNIVTKKHKKNVVFFL